MLRRDVLLVGVLRDGVVKWGSVSSAVTLEKLYKSRSELFAIHKSRVYLLPRDDAKDVALDMLSDAVLGIVGCNEHEDLQNISLSIASLSNYIKKNAVCVAEMRDDTLLWVEDVWALDMKLQTLHEEWSRGVEKFCMIDKKLYYIKPKQEIVEELYFKCVELAGSELRLAKALARCEVPLEKKESHRKVMMRNVAALRRFSFKQRDNFARYVGLFTKYLQNNGMPMDGLFAESVEVSHG